MDGEVLDADSFQAIARLPGLDVLHGQLVGLTASPLTGLITGLNSMITGLAIALGQIAERGLVTGEAEEGARPPSTPRRRPSPRSRPRLPLTRRPASRRAERMPSRTKQLQPKTPTPPDEAEEAAGSNSEQEEPSGDESDD